MKEEWNRKKKTHTRTHQHRHSGSVHKKQYNNSNWNRIYRNIAFAFQNWNITSTKWFSVPANSMFSFFFSFRSHDCLLFSVCLHTHAYEDTYKYTHASIHNYSCIVSSGWLTHALKRTHTVSAVGGTENGNNLYEKWNLWCCVCLFFVCISPFTRFFV